MDPLTIGLGVSVLGSALGAFSQDRANRQNLRAQRERQQRIDSMFNANRPGTVDMGAFMNEYARSQNPIEQIGFQAMSMPGTEMVTGPQFAGYNPMQISGDFGYDAALADFTPAQRTIGQSFNTGQDALSQFLRADPYQLQENQRLAQIADTGLGSDFTSVLDMLNAQQDTERERAMAEIRGASGSVGQRFGSAVRQQEQRALEDILTRNMAQRSQLALGVQEAIANRRLSAAQQLAQNEIAGAQLGLQGRGLTLQAAQALQQGGLAESDFGIRSAQLANQAAQFNAGAFNQARQFGAANAAQIALANQGAFNQAGQFNAATALQAGQFNSSLAQQQLQQLFQNRFAVEQANNQFGMQAAQQNFSNQLQNRQFGINTLNTGYGALAQRQSLLNQQLIAQAGQPVPQALPSQFGPAISDMGQLFAFLPMMQSMMGGQRAMPSTAPTVSPVGARGQVMQMTDFFGRA